MKKQGLVSKGINALGLVIAFNRGIGSALSSLQSGQWFSDPKTALESVVFVETGVDPVTGNVNYTNTTASAVSKIAGFGWIKAAHWFKRHAKV